MTLTATKKQLIIAKHLATAKERAQLTQALIGAIKNISCCLCGKVVTYKKGTFIFDIDLKVRRKSNNKVKKYTVCNECFDTSDRLIRQVGRMPFEEMPLHINDDNIFVVRAVSNRLKKGE